MTFNLALFENPNRLERHLGSDATIKEIKWAKKNEPLTLCRPSTTTKVAAAVFNPFLELAALFFHITSFSLGLLSYRLGAISSVIAQHFYRPWQQVCSFAEYPQLKVPSFNTPQIGTSDVYGMSPFSVNTLRHSAVKEATHLQVEWKAQSIGLLKQCGLKKSEQGYENWLQKFKTSPGETIKEIDDVSTKQELYKKLKQIERSVEAQYSQINLYPEHGISHGAALFFLHLYLQTASVFDEFFEKDARFVAEKFRYGLPRECLILQTFGKPEIFIHMDKKEISQPVPLYDLDNKPGAIAKKLSSLKEGSYQINLLQYSYAYITRGTRGYLFDPNVGLLRMSPEEVDEHILKTVHQKGNPEAVLRIYQCDKKG